MSALDPDVVRAAAESWLYVPPDAVERHGAGFRLVAYPETWAEHTVVVGIDASTPSAEVVDGALALAAGLGRTSLWFRTHAGSTPDGVVEELRRRGAEVAEELAVLARSLITADQPDRPDLPDLAVPDDVEVRPTDDLDSVRDADRLAVAVFGGSERDRAALEQDLARQDVATGISLLACRGGVPVGTAGLTVHDGVARLWGGAVLEAARGTGVYRALLDDRLRRGVGLGCTTALVKGRIETSAPVLRRAGFTSYGAETSYRLG